MAGPAAGPHDALAAYARRRRLVDMARGRPASQSSLSPWSTPDDAAAAVSGEVPVDFAFHTDLEPDPWWQVDLGSDYPIELIVVHNRRLSCQDRARALRVLVSRDGADWTTVHTGHVTFGDGYDGLPLMVTVLGEVIGRYVRLTVPGTTYLHLGQVQVFAAGGDRGLLDRLRRLAAPGPARTIEAGVLGTSNSVMPSGYTAHLAEYGLGLRCNLSLGASHPTVVPYRWSDERIAGCTVMVFDLNVSEQFGVDHGVYPLELTEQVFRFILMRCAALRIVPVILLMPEGMSYAPGSDVAFACRDNWIRLCHAHDIPYFDGFRMLEHVAEVTGEQVRSFLRDPLHVDRRIHAFLAGSLGVAVASALPGLRMVDAVLDVADFEYVPVAKASPGEDMRVVRSTSIVTETVSQIRFGQALSFALPAGSQVVGLVLNVRGSNAALRLSASNSVTKNLATPNFAPGKTAWLMSWALLTPVLVGDGALRVECVLSDAAGPMEANDQGDSRPSVPPGDAVIELGGLIVMMRPQARSVVSFPGADLDLWGGLPARLAAAAPA